MTLEGVGVRPHWSGVLVSIVLHLILLLVEQFVDAPERLEALLGAEVGRGQT